MHGFEIACAELSESLLERSLKRFYGDHLRAFYKCADHCPNLTSKSGTGGAPSGTMVYDQNNHKSGQSYDANGNTSSDNNNTIGYTVENKMNSQTSQWYPYGETLFAYDPWGKRVMKETNPDPYNYEGEDNPSWEFYFYGIDGKRLVTMDCSNPNGNPLPSCWVVGENIYFKKKMLVSNGVNVVTDRLGTVRANTQGESFAYFPYGEERTSTVDGRDKFATYFRDGVGQDYADQRYYNGTLGRFWTADPAGTKAARLGNPTSWNFYSYALGDPVNFNDPVGKASEVSECVDGADDACIDEDCGDGEAPCGAEGDDNSGGGSGGGDGSDQAGSGAGTCTADTCITVTATQALVPTVTVLSPVVLPQTFTDTVLGFIDTALGYASNTIGATIIMVLNPTPTAACDTLTCLGISPDAPTYTPAPWKKPVNASGRWTCQARCQVVDYSTGNTTYGPWVPGSGSTEGEACQAAQSAARQTSPPGSYTRHCDCGNTCQRR